MPKIIPAVQHFTIVRLRKEYNESKGKWVQIGRATVNVADSTSRTSIRSGREIGRRGTSVPMVAVPYMAW